MQELTAEVKRDHKSTVFQMLFSDKKELLGLYNALNHSGYTNTDDLTITTLENAIYLSMKNDISFVFQSRLFLFEHQSTVNPNMPLRDLFYVSDQLKGMTAGKRIYGSRRIIIPEPRFVVFYNGTADQPDYLEYRLSEMYEKESAEPHLDLRVQVYNVNYGHNSEMMAACKTLQEYSCFVQRIRENRKTMEIREAVEAAVDYCIKNEILRDFLLKHKAEATSMSIYEYDEEKYRQDLLAEGREEGYEEGREEERINTEREKARADAAEAEVARLREKLAEMGLLQNNT